MKTQNNPSEKKCSGLHAIALATLLFSSTLATSLVAYADCSNCTIIETLNNLHNKNMEMVKNNFIYAVDKWLEKINLNNKSLLTRQQKVDTAVSNSSASLVDYYLNGIGTKDDEEYKLSVMPAAEDTTAAATGVDYKNSAFTATPDNTDSTEINLNTAIMNTDSLLGPRQYSDAQKDSAQSLLRYIEAIAPLPNVIRLGNECTVPFSKIANRNTTTLTLTGNGNDKKKKLSNIIADLSAKSEYRKYKVSYRSNIATRTMLLNNLLRIYQSRVAPQNSKSAAELEYEAATWRLQPAKSGEQSYYDSINQASPAVVNREMLFLLAEIRHELYQLRQQNERMIALQSLSGLREMETAYKQGSFASNQSVSKLIYCAYLTQENGKDKVPDECKQSDQQPKSPAS